MAKTRRPHRIQWLEFQPTSWYTNGNISNVQLN